MSEINLTHSFLLAMPSTLQNWFANSLIYVCRHDREGAFGLIVNRRSSNTFKEILQQTKIEELIDTDKIVDEAIWIGGPVRPDCGFVLHPRTEKDRWHLTAETDEDVTFTSSRDIIVSIAKGKGPEKRMITLGYTGWGAGQLEQELLQNAWLTCPADQEILFDTPGSKRLAAVSEKIGVDFDSLSPSSGHA